MGSVDDPRGAEARRLRAEEGLTRREIAERLGIRSEKQLTAWLKGTTPPAWTRRPTAKDEVKEQARKLRAEGRSVNEIATLLDVSKSSVSIWVRDVLLSPEQRAALRATLSGRRAQAGATRRARRIAETARIQAAAAADIGDLTEREVFLMGVAAYWAEGEKAKPWNVSASVSFMNSDARLVLLFLAFLDGLGITREVCTFRVAIHESADEAAARTWWADQLGVPVERFARSTLKRHNPKTTRGNTGASYRGCVVVRVRRSTKLNRRIEGWWAASPPKSASRLAPSGRAWCNRRAQGPLKSQVEVRVLAPEPSDNQRDHPPPVR